MTTSAASLLIRAARIEREHQLLGRVQSLSDFMATERDLARAGLGRGEVSFCEIREQGRKPRLSITATENTPGLTKDGTEEAFARAVGLNLFAGMIRRSGRGEFFSVKVNFATFHADYVAPVWAELEREGVAVDLLPAQGAPQAASPDIGPGTPKLRTLPAPQPQAAQNMGLAA